MKKPLIGFIGQGYVGKNYADDFERRGFKVVRYSKEEPHIQNEHKIASCGVVFIAVPTPTTPKGFDVSVVEKVLQLVGAGKIAVIKSTILPGTTIKLQKKYPEKIILFSPEFLSEVTAAYEAAHPFLNVVGTSLQTIAHKRAAEKVLKLLPEAPFADICSSTEAEFIKYSHNISGYVQIVLFNVIYDLANKMGADWNAVHKALVADPYISGRYAKPVHKSGRGAGGSCFVKDYRAFLGLYKKMLKDRDALAFLEGTERKNIALLKLTKKDLHIVRSVYGK